MENPEFRFGDCILRPATRELFRNGTNEDVQPRVFDVLVYLVENADRLISKDELLDNVWGHQSVSESALARTVMKVRKAIGDDAHDPRFVMTHHGYGYRFVGDVELVPESVAGTVPLSTSTGGAGRSRRRGTRADREDIFRRLGPVLRHFRFHLMVIIVLMVALGMALLLMPERAGSKPLPRLVVMPVVNTIADPSMSWVQLGLMSLMDESIGASGHVDIVSTGEVLGALAATGNKVTDASTSGQLQQLGTTLNAAILVRGWLRLKKGTYQLDVHVIKNGERAFKRTFSGNDPTTLAIEAGTTVAGYLSSKQNVSTSQAGQYISSDRYINQTYARALDAMARGNFENASRLFGIVVSAEDGRLGYKVQLAEALVRAGRHQEAKALADKILEIAQQRHDTLVLARIYDVLSRAMSQAGDLDAASAYARKELAMAFPAHPEIKPNAQLQIGRLAYERSRFGEAEKYVNAAIVGYRSMNSPYLLSGAYLQLGRITQRSDAATAMTYLQRAVDLARKGGRHSIELKALIFLAASSRIMGDCQQARQYLDKGVAMARENENRHELARVHLVRSRCQWMAGHLDKAIEETLKAKKLAESLDDPGLLALALLAYAGDLARKPETRLDQVQPVYERAASLFEMHGARGQAAGALLNLAQILIGAEHYDEAKKTLARSQVLSEDTDDLALKVGPRILQAKVAYRQDDKRKSLDLMRKARSMADPNSRLWVMASASMAWLYLDLGQIRDARDTLTAAAGIRKSYVALCVARARLLYQQRKFHSAQDKQTSCIKQLGERASDVDRAICDTYAKAAKKGRHVPLPAQVPSVFWL